MKHLGLIALLLATPVLGEGWTPMSGQDILVALTDQRVEYEAAWQEFKASGRTLYTAGETSWGYWRVEGNQYCSQWPPGGQWDCYKMDRKGETVRFVSEFGDVSEAQIVK